MASENEVVESKKTKPPQKVFGMDVKMPKSAKKASSGTKSKSKEVKMGDSPMVNLLPREVTVGRKNKAAKILAFRVLGGAVAFSMIAFAGAWGMSTLKDQELQKVYVDISNLTIQQSKFTEVVSLQNQIEKLGSARQTATETEIDWSSFMTHMNNSLPPGATIGSITLNIEKISKRKPAATPSAAPTEGGTKKPATPVKSTDLNFSVELIVTSLALPEQFKQNLSTLKGFKSATFSDATQLGKSSQNTKTDETLYSISSTIIFSNELLWNRFSETPKGK